MNLEYNRRYLEVIGPIQMQYPTIPYTFTLDRSRNRNSDHNSL